MHFNIKKKAKIKKKNSTTLRSEIDNKKLSKILKNYFY